MKGVGRGQRDGRDQVSLKKGRAIERSRWRGEGWTSGGSGEDKEAGMELLNLCYSRETAQAGGRRLCQANRKTEGEEVLVIRENLTKGLKGGENHCDGDIAEKRGGRDSGKEALKQTGWGGGWKQGGREQSSEDVEQAKHSTTESEGTGREP